MLRLDTSLFSGAQRDAHFASGYTSAARFSPHGIPLHVMAHGSRDGRRSHVQLHCVARSMGLGVVASAGCRRHAPGVQYAVGHRGWPHGGRPGGTNGTFGHGCGGCSGAVHSWHPLALVLAADDCPPHRDGHRGGPAGRYDVAQCGSNRRRSLRLNRRPAVIRGFGGRCSPRGRDGVPPHRVAGGTCCVHRPGRNADRRQRKSPCQHGAWLGDLCMVFRNVGTGWHPHRHGRGRGHARHLLLHRHLVLHPHRQSLVQGPCRQVLLASSDALCGLDRPTAHHCCRGRRLASAVVS